jgi:hypothetical protein
MSMFKVAMSSPLRFNYFVAPLDRAVGVLVRI